MRGKLMAVANQPLQEGQADDQCAELDCLSPPMIRHVAMLPLDRPSLGMPPRYHLDVFRRRPAQTGLTARMLIGGVLTAVLLTGCATSALSGRSCTSPTPTSTTWPAYVVDIVIPEGTLVELTVLMDGQETLGRWSVPSSQLPATAELLRTRLVEQGFALEGPSDSEQVAYARHESGQIVDVTATGADSCGQVVLTVDSIAGMQPDPPQWS